MFERSSKLTVDTSEVFERSSKLTVDTSEVFERRSSGDAYAYDEEWLTDQDNSLHDDNGKQRPLEQTTGSMIRHASKRHPVNNPLV